MRIKDYLTPASPDEALDALHGRECTKLLAGGTDLIIALRERNTRADVLIDLSRISMLRRIYVEDGVLHIGSMSTFHDIEGNADVLKHCPMLADAASQVGAPQIRARATIGGNVANAATAADSIPPLLAMDASAVVKRKGGSRILPVESLVVGLNETTLEPDELIVEFLIPIREGAFLDFEKIGRRRALAISRINLAVLLEMEGACILKAAIAVGAVGKTAYRVRELEGMLAGRVVDEALITEACNTMDEIVARNLAGRKTTPYKRRIAAAVLGRAFEKLSEVSVYENDAIYHQQ